MSNSPEFNPIPAYEMLQTIYQPEKAQQLYESMIHEEKQTTCYLMHLCKARKQAMQASSDEVLIQSLPYSLVEQDITISDKVTQFLKYLGYKPQIIAGVTSSEPVPVLIINW